MRKLVLLLFGVMLLSGCNNNSTDEQQWETSATRQITNVESNNGDDDCIIDCDYPIHNDLIGTDISDFKLGMRRSEILEKIGRPHTLYGYGFVTDLYNIDGDNAFFYYYSIDGIEFLDALVVCTSTDCKKLK